MAVPDLGGPDKRSIEILIGQPLTRGKNFPYIYDQGKKSSVDQPAQNCVG